MWYVTVLSLILNHYILFLNIDVYLLNQSSLSVLGVQNIGFFYLFFFLQSFYWQPEVNLSMKNVYDEWIKVILQCTCIYVVD